MSHQTGIHASEELKALFAKCKSQREIRCLKMSIDKEKLVCDETRQMSISTNSLDWKQDWRAYMVESFLPKQRPCYVLFRLGSTTDHQEIIVAAPTTSTNASTTQTPPASKPSKSFVSKLTGPPKLASILTKSLNHTNSSSTNNNSLINNNNDKGTTNNDNGKETVTKVDVSSPDEAAKDQWLFVSWTPESSSVREKMIYASTKSTAKQEFGGGSIFADYFVACSEDLSVEAVTKWIERKQHIRDGHIDMNELSLGEQELQQVKLDEAALCADLLAAAIKDKQTKSLPNIEMPMSDDVITALYNFKQGKSAYVQLSIDPKSETILMEKNEPVGDFDLSKRSISSLTPRDHARYHLVSYNHQHNKKQTKATLFIYSIPSSGCPVKERMLYSSVKNSLLQVIQEESKIGITVDRRIETDDPSELTEKFLYDELYPADNSQLTPQAFVKPKGPSKQTPSSRRRVM